MQSGIKPTAQRIAVMDYLQTHRTHPTADEIYSALLPEYPTISRTTVYNSLKSLVNAGAALSLDMEAGNTHYDGHTAPHAHFFCTRCGKIVDVEMPNMPEAPAEFGAVTTDVVFRGICAECKGNDKQTNNQ